MAGGCGGEEEDPETGGWGGTGGSVGELEGNVRIMLMEGGSYRLFEGFADLSIRTVRQKALPTAE